MVVLVTFYIRRTLHEPPTFEDAKAQGEIAKIPLIPLMRDHWRDVLRVILCTFIAAVSTVFGNLAIGTQLGFLMAGFAPSIVAGLGGVEEGGWVVISIFTGVICLIAALSALTARETKDVPTETLGIKVIA